MEVDLGVQKCLRQPGRRGETWEKDVELSIHRESTHFILNFGLNALCRSLPLKCSPSSKMETREKTAVWLFGNMLSQSSNCEGEAEHWPRHKQATTASFKNSPVVLRQIIVAVSLGSASRRFRILKCVDCTKLQCRYPSLNFPWKNLQWIIWPPGQRRFTVLVDSSFECLTDC